MTMNSNFVSTRFLANNLVLPVQQAQAQLATATTEESTGQYADLGLQLGDQSGYELSLKEQVQRLQTLTAGNSLVSTSLSSAQDALTTMSTRAQSTVQDLATWTASANSGAQLQTMGQTALQELTASANATSGGAYLFGGVNSAAAPLASDSSSSMTTAATQAFETAFGVAPTDAAAANITVSQMQSFLSGSFAGLFSDASWTSIWSSASSANTSAEIAPGETATTSTNANAPAFQQLAEAYTMLAAFGGSSLSLSAQQAVASAATSLVSKGQSALTDTQAALGATQSQVTDANSAMSMQLTVIESQTSALDAPDLTALSAKITSLTNQIQMAYELTARLQQLNLAQYLPVS